MTSPILIVQPVAAAVRLLLVVLALGGALACGSTPPPAPGPASPPAEDRGPQPKYQLTLSEDAQRASGIAVGTADAEARAGHFETSAVLRVDEKRTARIGSLVDGVVTGADVQVGDRVRRGQRLASIHSHAVHDAWAGYRKAVADRQRAAAELTYATSSEARATRLLAAKAVSQQELERARTDRTAAEQAVAIAESEVRRSLDELEHLGISGENVDIASRQDTVPIAAPLAGVVLERLVTNGTAVTIGTPLYVTSDLTTLWAIAEVDEVRLPLLGAGRTAQLAVAAYPGRTFPARVLAIGESVNPETRRVTVRIEVDNRDGLLKPEMFATVGLATGEDREAVTVPAAAVQQLDQQAVVFVEVTPGTFRRQAVTLGPERDGRVEVAGIAPGTRIAVSGTFLLKSKLLESDQPE